MKSGEESTEDRNRGHQNTGQKRREEATHDIQASFD